MMATWRPSKKAVEAALTAYVGHEPPHMTIRKEHMKAALVAAWKVDHPKGCIQNFTTGSSSNAEYRIGFNSAKEAVKFLKMRMKKPRPRRQRRKGK